MRRRLALLSLAITTLVVIALMVPLGLLVRRQAAQTAQVEAELSARSTAGLVALSAALGIEADPSSVANAIGELPAGQVVYLPDGTVIGDPAPGQGSQVEVALATSASSAAEVEGGWELAVPVVAPDGVAVVSAFVTDGQLTSGVWRAWGLLALLGVLIIGAAVAVADRLGRRLVAPITELASTAQRLGEGDLDARVTISPPEEIEELGRSFNWLADRLVALLAEEREGVADLSHRLRTPLTALRLQADGVADPESREALVAQVERLEHAVDQLIDEARRERSRAPGVSDLGAVVSGRAGFWRVLAEEQGRRLTVSVPDDPVRIAQPEDMVAAVVDTLIENVFSHTPEGTDFSVSVAGGPRPLLEISDSGPGFRTPAAVGRGVSGAGSTGLGLDIARRTAESSGGALELDDRPGGGAVVRVWFGPG